MHTIHYIHAAAWRDWNQILFIFLPLCDQYLICLRQSEQHSSDFSKVTRRL